MGLAIAACSHTAKIGVRSDGQDNARVAASSPLAQGRALYARQEYALAIEKFNQVVREAPDKPEGYNALAASYDMLGRYDVSRRYYELALSHAPADGRIYRNMARSLRMQGREGEALAVLAEWNALVKDGVAVAEAAPPAAGTVQPVAIALSDPKPTEAPAQPKPLPVEASSVVAVAVPADVPRARTSATVDIPAAVPAAAAVQIAAAPSPSYRTATAAIRIMNGVGKRGLARGVQTWLAQSGWPQSRTGDLDSRYSRSYLVFPKAAQADAINLSKSLPFPTGKVVNERASRIVLILGRNAAGVDFRSMPARPVAG